jgi:phosphonate dehydrogenase
MSKLRVVISHRVFPETRDALLPHCEVIAPGRAEILAPSRLHRELARADAWMAFMPDRADAAVLEHCKNLRLIAGALKGCDNFDIAACSHRRIWVSIVPDLLTIPTAELTIALMIGVGRHLIEGDRLVRSRRYRNWRPRLYGCGLAGSKVAFIGMGAIGQAISQRLQCFDVEQRYFDPHRLDATVEQILGLGAVASLRELLGWCDYLVLAAPLSAQTLHLIDETALSQIKPGCLLVNPARGSLVDEAAVLAALNSGRLGGYAADVFEMEDFSRPERPRTIMRALRRHPATFFTPHLGSAVIDVRRAIELCAAENIIDLCHNRVPRNAVNPEAWITPMQENDRKLPGKLEQASTTVY